MVAAGMALMAIASGWLPRLGAGRPPRHAPPAVRAPAVEECAPDQQRRRHAQRHADQRRPPARGGQAQHDGDHGAQRGGDVRLSFAPMARGCRHDLARQARAGRRGAAQGRGGAMVDARWRPRGPMAVLRRAQDSRLTVAQLRRDAARVGALRQHDHPHRQQRAACQHREGQAEMAARADHRVGHASVMAAPTPCSVSTSPSARL